MFESVTFSRDCEVIQIPSGTKITLPKGTQGRITQSLGGAYTVLTDQGMMVSVGSGQEDAIGKEARKAAEPSPSISSQKSLEEMVWDQLKTCYDPEIPHNIVDLGLIYECRFTPVPEKEGQRVDIKMSLTAQGCGMGDWLKQDILNKLNKVSGIKEVSVEVVFDPPWTPEKMSPVLRRYLNM